MNLRRYYKYYLCNFIFRSSSSSTRQNKARTLSILVKALHLTLPSGFLTVDIQVHLNGQLCIFSMLINIIYNEQVFASAASVVLGMVVIIGTEVLFNIDFSVRMILHPLVVFVILKPCCRNQMLWNLLVYLNRFAHFYLRIETSTNPT